MKHFDYAMTYEQVAAALGISRARVHQLEKRALRKLQKRPLLLKRFKEVVEMRRAVRDGEEWPL